VDKVLIMVLLLVRGIEEFFALFLHLLYLLLVFNDFVFQSEDFLMKKALLMGSSILTYLRFLVNT
jgi:hypothetical protein